LPECVSGAVLETTILSPGESIQFTESLGAESILGDSLASGSYRFTVSGEHMLPPIPGELTSGTLTLGP
jgi:hypothetical protein